MIPATQLNDKHATCKKQLRETVRPVHYVGKIAPEGYIPSGEFRKLAIAKVNKFCDDHGLL